MIFSGGSGLTGPTGIGGMIATGFISVPQSTATGKLPENSLVGKIEDEASGVVIEMHAQVTWRGEIRSFPNLEMRLKADVMKKGNFVGSFPMPVDMVVSGSTAVDKVMTDRVLKAAGDIERDISGELEALIASGKRVTVRSAYIAHMMMVASHVSGEEMLELMQESEVRSVMGS